MRNGTQILLPVKQMLREITQSASASEVVSCIEDAVGAVLKWIMLLSCPVLGAKTFSPSFALHGIRGSRVPVVRSASDNTKIKVGHVSKIGALI